MPAGVLFWVIMIVWLLFGFWGQRTELAARNFGGVGGTLLEFVLFALLGWRLFGAPLQ
jgi:hypothetical protein